MGGCHVHGPVQATQCRDEAAQLMMGCLNLPVM
jgi:hypothetical protein